MPGTFGQQQACKRKVRHGTKHAAEIARRKTLKMLKAKTGKDHKLIQYYCPHCDGWHVGHKMPEETKGKKKRST